MGYDCYSVQGEEYYRINIWGMQSLREGMYATNILTEEVPSPDFPEHEPFDEEEQYEAYRASLIPMLSQTSPNGRIPDWKFGSNDGWIVTPAECLLIVQNLPRYEVEFKNGMRDKFKEFIDFARTCSTLGGFTVY